MGKINYTTAEINERLGKVPPTEQSATAANMKAEQALAKAQEAITSAASSAQASASSLAAIRSEIEALVADPNTDAAVIAKLADCLAKLSELEVKVGDLTGNVPLVEIIKDTVVFNTNSTNKGYYTHPQGYDTYVFDVSNCVGKSLVCHHQYKTNCYRYCGVRSYKDIPESVDIETWNNILVIDGGKASVASEETTTITITEGCKYLLLFSKSDYICAIDSYGNIKEDIDALKGDVQKNKEAITDIQAEIKTDVAKDNIRKSIAKKANGSYSGEIGGTITEISDSYTARFTADVSPNSVYAIAPCSKVFITDKNDVVLDIKSGGSFSNAHSYCTCRFTTPSNAAKVYWIGSRTLPSDLIEVKNGNKIVIYKGEKEYFTTNINKSKVVTIEGEEAIELTLEGSGEVVFNLSDYHQRVGLWAKILCHEFDKINDVSIAFAKDGETINSKKLKENYFSVKGWYYAINYLSTSSINEIKVVYDITEGKSVSMYVSPFAYVNRVTMPTFIFNCEHWSLETDIDKFKAFTDRGLRVSITGKIPTSDANIAYCREMVSKGLIDYGIYGNEFGGSAESLMASTEPVNQYVYAQKVIADKLKVTDKVLVYGAETHQNAITGVQAAKSLGVRVLRFNAGSNQGNVPMLADTDDTICMSICSFGNLSISNISQNNGIIGYFVHTSTTDTPLTITDSLLEKLNNCRSMIDNGFGLNVTMRDLYETYLHEFVE